MRMVKLVELLDRGRFTGSAVWDSTGQASQFYRLTSSERTVTAVASASRVHYARRESDVQHYDRPFGGLCGRHLDVLTTPRAIYRPLMCSNQI